MQQTVKKKFLQEERLNKGESCIGGKLARVARLREKYLGCSPGRKKNLH